MTNKNWDNFRDGRNNSNNNYKLTISEQIDLLYLENNELKAYVGQMENDRTDLVKHYEEQLNKSQYELNAVKEEMFHSKNRFDNQMFHMNDEIQKYRLITDEKINENKAISDQYHKLEERYRVANEYINVLPTPQETDKLNKTLRRLKIDNDKYRNQYHEAELIICRLQNEVAEKNVQLANLVDNEVIMKSQIDLLGDRLSSVKCSSFVKVEKREAGEEGKNEGRGGGAGQTLINDDWKYSADIYVDLKMTVERYKNELINSKQLLDAERKKFQKHVCDCQKKMEDLHAQLEVEAETVVALRQEIDSRQMTCNELEKKLKASAQEKQNILGNMIDLEKEIERIDCLGSADKVKRLFQRLLGETLSCVRDTDTVVSCIHRLMMKQDIDLSVLFGCSELENLTVSDDNGSIDRLMDKNYLQNQLGVVKQAKTRIAEIRDALVQRYTDNMAQDVKFCSIQ